MKFVSRDGAIFELAVDSYQFPAREGAVFGRDADSNWLNVRGNLSLPDGRSSNFRDPCLTTWDARELADWLRSVSCGHAPSLSSNDGPGLVFDEPCLAFDAEQLEGDTAVLRVYLSLEAEPAFVVEGAHGMFENYVQLTMSLAELGRAAAEWDAEIKAYPVR
ncbi:hypothetical protein J2W21_003606 [Sinomonas atrocyanea]|uniref:WapI family immunity protein n=1 Tax=Sinomonas atrocyanea TaxID=37927 RepID=UPI0027862616|nr:hypothetical protein [Sinomonas atrocyanea]MDP9886081.1 hypothetical protein [Sinomonas atrocyanea]